ncbi:MAG: ABC transporter ATP-binding protein [Burkholderiales bacterium]|nr:ABC transporter ATP-binding protein [Burkholderiales bacterium]
MIRLENIRKKFTVGDQVVAALKDISLDVKAGEYLSIMGPSGSGKSTLLNLIGLLDRPTSGTYAFDGMDVTRLSDDEQAAVRREKIGFVFQFFHLIPRLSARENVELPMMLAGIAGEERKARSSRLLSDLGLDERGQHRPEQLSGGQRQRVAIARATVMNPRILLADEPTGNLDRVSGMDVIALLEKLNLEGMTLILVTHDPEIGKRANRQVLMLDGEIESDKT